MTGGTLVHDRTLVDWITVTCARGEPLEALLRGPTEVMPNGMYSYRSAVRDGHGTIYAWNGPQPRPYMLIFSSAALDAWRVPVFETHANCCGTVFTVFAQTSHRRTLSSSGSQFRFILLSRTERRSG